MGCTAAGRSCDLVRRKEATERCFSVTPVSGAECGLSGAAIGSLLRLGRRSELSKPASQ